MPYSYENALTIAGNYDNFTPLQNGIRIIDNFIIDTLVKQRNATQIKIPVVNFPVPSNTANWKSISDAYTMVGWLVIRDNKYITLIYNDQVS